MSSRSDYTVAAERTTATPNAAAPSTAQRNAWMDNLRVTLIVGVIAVHVAATYIIDIGWYYRERTASELTQVIFWIPAALGGVFGMGLLFLLAGMLTPRALARKGPGRFAVDRLVRLGIPTLLFTLVLRPVTDLIGIRAMGGHDSFTRDCCLGQIRRGEFRTGILWFAAMLLAFSLAYAVVRHLRPAHPGHSRLTGRYLVGVAAAIAVATFLVRLVWPFASDTPLELNLWESPQMIALFTLGVFAAERHWLDDGLPDAFYRRLRTVAIAGGVLMIGLVAFVASKDDDTFLGGFRPQAAFLPAFEGVLAVTFSLLMLEWFRRRWNHAGRFARELGRASFGAYVVHATIIVLLAVAIRSLAIPAEAKWLLVTATGVVCSFGLAWLLTKIRPLARIV